MRSSRAVELQFDPVFDLAFAGAGPGGSMDFDSLGDDPQFSVRAMPGLDAIRPGWWRLEGHLEAIDGAIIAPRFYPDHGGGLSEADCIPVAGALRNGRIDAVLFVKAPIRSLRFDPTVRPTRFRIGTMRLTPLPRARAVARMLAGVAAGRFGSRSHAASAAAALVRDGIRKTPSRAARALYEEYIRADALPEGGYDLWHRLFDPLQSALEQQAAAALAGMSRPPAFALVVNARRASSRSLRRCLDSLRRQTWPLWQACVDASSAPEAMRSMLEEYARGEPRIRVRTHSGGKVADALDSLPQDYVGFLEPEAQLAPGALCELAHVVHRHPASGLVYTDGDRIDAHGERVDPCFKPEWNPTLLLAQDYIGHFSVFRRDVLEAAREVSTNTPGWHHDLVLRCADTLAPEQIRHVPRVLYHDGAARPAAGREQANASAVREFLGRHSIPAKVSVLASGQLRVTPQLPSPAPSVTIVVPTRDRLPLLRTCVESVLERTRYPNYEILIVDNASEEPQTLEYLDRLRSRARCRVMSWPAAFNFSAITNAGVAASTAEIVCLLNNDIEVISPDWLDEMVGHATCPGVGTVGAMLYYPDDTIQHGGVVLGIGGVAGHVHHRSRRGTAGHQGRARVAQDMSAVTAACMAVRRAVFEEVGGFDEALAVAFNDIDFCLRVREAGYSNRWTPHAELYHHESASRGQEDTPEKKARFLREVESMKRRWGAVLLHDPAYNPNLTLDWSNFELAFPPRVPPPAWQAGHAPAAAREPEDSKALRAMQP